MFSVKRFFLFVATVSAILISVLQSCTLLETTPVKVPAYIYVPYLRFKTLPGQGDSSFKFPDVWIYDKGILLGNIGLPALIPIQESGMSEIDFDGGILSDGADYSRMANPFTKQAKIYHTLIPGKIDTCYPIIEYLSNTKFSIIEGFESPGFAFSYDTHNTPGDTIIRVHDSLPSNSSIYLGKSCGNIQMAASSQRFQITSSAFLKDSLEPVNGFPVYLEMDFKTDISIDVGMYITDLSGNSTTIQPEISLYPTSNSWNKVYVQLDQDIARYNAATSFTIVIAVNNLSGNKPNIYIDNIKLVHF